MKRRLDDCRLGKAALACGQKWVVGVVSKIVGSAQLLTFALLWHWRVEAAIGVSRVCLGAHYLSDMLSVAAADLTWLALSLTAVDTSRRNQFVRKIRNGV